MNLTDIMLFGKVIFGSDSNDGKTVFSYDGNRENTEDVWHKVSDATYDLSALETVNVRYTTGEEQVLTREQFHIAETDGGWVAVMDSTAPLLMSIPLGTALAEAFGASGIFVAHMEDYYVSRIEFAPSDSGSGGTHNALLLTSDELETAERLPEEIVGCEMVRISDKSFKPDELIGGYLASSFQLGVVQFLAENTIDAEGLYTVTQLGDFLALFSIYEDAADDEIVMKGGTYINAQFIPNNYDTVLFVVPA